MSRAATNWAWDLDIKPATLKILLLSMADRADEYHVCYPSNARLQKDTGLNIKTVQKGIVTLIELGLLTDTGKRKGATGQVRVFQLNLEVNKPNIGNDPKNGVVKKEASNNGACEGNDPNIGNDPKNGVGNDPNIGVQNLPLGSISSSGSKEDDSDDPKIPLVNPYQTIIDKWNDSGFIPIRSISVHREKLLKARLKEFSIDQILEAIEIGSQSNFLKGGGAKGWIMDFTWFLNPNKFIYVYEGKYSNRTQGIGNETNQQNLGTPKSSPVDRLRARSEASTARYIQELQDEQAHGGS